MAVYSRCLTNVANLVRETDFQRVETVAGILDHLGGLERGHEQWRFDASVEFAD